MSFKNLNKKIRRLVTRIEKDTKKLAKFRLKLSAPVKKKKDSGKKGRTVARRKHGSNKKAKVPAPAKKKRHITPEGRAKLAAAMNARWAAKRAAVQTASPSAVVVGS
ncbi:MAG: hypothetical protein JWO45_263 [Spartobacteria bacterium]|nr:hypothetical protein [Spartobacteria bacterium]